MKRVPLAKYRHAALDLQKYLKTHHKSLPPERAFVLWYLEARFGSAASTVILDGKSDGGLDAVYETPSSVFVFQSKYERIPKAALIQNDEVYSFEQKARLFKVKAEEDAYLAWLGKVRPSIRPVYDRVRERSLQDPRQSRFVLITTKRSDFDENDLYEIEDIQSVAALWYLYSEGFTPPTDKIQLQLDSHWHAAPGNGGYRTYVGLTDIREFLELMRRDHSGRLFAQNVRTNLRSKVNLHIRETYESEPEIFWLCNNGIYIVCKKVTSSGNLHTLVYPSVINGAQTLHAIEESRKRHSCKILVRILEMDLLGDAALLSAVVRRTNTQNTMKLTNLFAHDHAQLLVALYLDRYRIFYERREREWQNEKKAILSSYIQVNMKDVAQWLSALQPSIGLGTARSRVSSLFEESVYEKLFGQFDSSFVSPAYDSLVLVVWAGLFLSSCIARLPTTTKPKARIARLLLVGTLVEAIEASRLLRSLIPELLNQHMLGRRSIPLVVVAEVNRIVRLLAALQRKAQNRDPNLDFSNYFKRDDLTSAAYKAAAAPDSLLRLRLALEKGLPRLQ
jgi:hypothetical protein